MLFRCTDVNRSNFQYFDLGADLRTSDMMETLVGATSTSQQYNVWKDRMELRYPENEEPRSTPRWQSGHVDQPGQIEKAVNKSNSSVG